MGESLLRSRPHPSPLALQTPHPLLLPLCSHISTIVVNNGTLECKHTYQNSKKGITKNDKRNIPTPDGKDLRKDLLIDGKDKLLDENDFPSRLQDSI